MIAKDTILSINTVEPGLVKAVKRHSEEMGKELKGLVLVNTDYAHKSDRPKDTTGLFTEIVCNFYNPAELQKVLQPYSERLLAVTCRLESAIQPFRQVIPFIPYVDAPSESSLLWSTEKPLMRDRLSTYDRALTPKYQYMEAPDIPKVKELVANFTFPVIVKPSSLAKSLLVTECKTMEELELCLVETFEIIEKVYAKEWRRSKPSVLVEEMMQGDMYSTDAYVTKDGEVFCLPLVKVITAHALGMPGFYGFRIITPTGLAQPEVDAAFKAATAAVKALHLRATTTHIELFHTADGWKIIELGARIGGYREALYREAFGIEHFYNDLAVRMDRPLKMPDAPIRHATGLNIYADEEGEIISIEGLEEARRLPSVRQLDAHASVGDIALFAQNGGELLVDAILSNTDSDQLEADVKSLRELIKFRIKPRKTIEAAVYA